MSPTPAGGREGFERMQAAAPTILDQFDATPNGVLNRDLARLLHSGDPRWGLPDRAADRRRDAGRPEGAARRRPDQGPIEVMVVGDISVDKAIDVGGGDLRRAAGRGAGRRRP